jgi:hypothetical protein
MKKMESQQSFGWIDSKLKAKNIHTFYKDKQDPPPSGSKLKADTFRCLRNGFIRIDATHNVTQYPDFLLFTIVARDWWGHGA